MQTRRIYFVSFILAALTVSIAAVAQEKFKLPPHKTPKAEFVEQTVAQAKSLSADKNVKSASLTLRAKVLSTRFKDVQPRTRGAQDVLIFRDAAPSVVLVLLGNGGICSGSVLKDNVILTAAHCVEDETGEIINQVIQEVTGRVAVREITVVFKPSDPSGKPQEREIAQAAVYKVDHQRDLALLRLLTPLPRTISPLDISSDDSIEIGADIHAIGHPHGLNWTYTKGIVSQVRPDYSFGSTDDPHRATVIQTQAAINGGNSGGPLLSDDGKIIGVVSFAERKAENLNFAIAAKEVRFFLNDTNNVLPVCDEPKPLSEREHDDTKKAFITPLSGRCDGEADIFIFEPDDQNKSFYALVRSRKNDKKYGVIYGQGRTGKWSHSVWDVKFDETYLLIGAHQDGKLLPSKIGNRCPRGSKAVPEGCSRI